MRFYENSRSIKRYKKYRTEHKIEKFFDPKKCHVKHSIWYGWTKKKFKNGIVDEKIRVIFFVCLQLPVEIYVDIYNFV